MKCTSEGLEGGLGVVLSQVGVAEQTQSRDAQHRLVRFGHREDIPGRLGSLR